jgi:transcriptional regulator with GAF, ATPase, and Fis domain
MSSSSEGGTSVLLPRDRLLPIPGVDVVVLEGPSAGKRVRIQQGVLRVGTAPSNHLVLADRTVSRLHCEIVVRAHAVTLRDPGSTNGTFVDGRRVRDVDLTHGTLVRLGATAFRVDIGAEPGFVELSERTSFGELVGASIEMRRVYAILERIAPTDSTCLLLGETGTGKEMVARALHDASARRAAPFVTLDCSALPDSLIESELFGHTRGAFTGAQMDRRGVFEEANGGTLFIDEVGELPLTMQPKLLRALESRSIRPVGANQQRPIDIRVVAATNRSLAQSVNEGSFREDLYYRLAVVEIELPPLRARREDVPALAAHFLERFTGKLATPPPEMLSSLMGRAWPGNIRELRNVIERSVSLGWPSAAAAGPSPRTTAAATAPIAAGAPIPVHLPLKEARVAWTEQFELVYVRALLEQTGGNVTRAAELAGVGRRFLQRAMVRLGIRAPEGPPERDDEPV